MTNNTTELNGRILFHWRPSDPQGFIASAQPNADRLADTISEVADRLFVRHGSSVAWLDDAGKPVGVTPTLAVEIIAKHIAYVVLVPHNGGWRREYRSFTFPQRPRFNPTSEHPDPPPETEPDSKVLDDLLRNKLPLRLPRVVES